MTGLGSLVGRNCRLFFKDKGMFFTSLITPAILLVLYATFLAGVYRDSFASAIPAEVAVDKALINATVGGQLVSSLLAVTCVTVAFCTNLLMAQDKVTGTRGDLTITPVKPATLALGYFLASALSTFLVCFVALAASLIYLAIVGWYLSFADVLLLFLEVCLLVLFGTAISSLVNYPLSTNGQCSAVGTIVSAGYGFICGAYMPISSFGDGTYGTSLIRNRALAGVFREMSAIGFPEEVLTGIKDSIDCNLYFFGHGVSQGVMFAVLAGSVALLVGAYCLLNMLRRQKV